MFCLISTLNFASVVPTVANGCGAKGCGGKTGLLWGTKCYNDKDCSKNCHYTVVLKSCLHDV